MFEAKQLPNDLIPKVACLQESTSGHGRGLGTHLGNQSFQVLCVAEPTRGQKRFEQSDCRMQWIAFKCLLLILAALSLITVKQHNSGSKRPRSWAFSSRVPTVIYCVRRGLASSMSLC